MAYTQTKVTQSAVGVDAQPGEELLDTPKSMGSLYADYMLKSRGGWSGGLRADFEYHGRNLRQFPSMQSVTYPNGTSGVIPDATQVQAAYHVVNAGAYWSNSTVTCRLFVDNILDAEPYLNFRRVPGFTGATTLRPRTDRHPLEHGVVTDGGGPTNDKSLSSSRVNAVAGRSDVDDTGVALSWLPCGGALGFLSSRRSPLQARSYRLRLRSRSFDFPSWSQAASSSGACPPRTAFPKPAWRRSSRTTRDSCGSAPSTGSIATTATNTSSSYTTRRAPTAWCGAYVHSCFKDRSGMLWIGCNQLVDRFDPRTEVFTHYRVEPGGPDNLT